MNWLYSTQEANNSIYCTSLRRRPNDVEKHLGVSKTEPLFVRKELALKWLEVLHSNRGGSKGPLLCVSLSCTNSLLLAPMSHFC